MLGNEDCAKLRNRIEKEVASAKVALEKGEIDQEKAVWRVASQIGYYHPMGPTPHEEARARALLGVA